MNKKPEPLYDPPTSRKHCPVCGEVSYSKAGIHPQCATIQADPLKQKQRKATTNKVKKRAMTPVMKPWHKQCPLCARQVHLRRKSCDCGYVFDGKRP